TSTQYYKAIQIAKAPRKLHGDKLTIVGHSLGGGLASTASLTCGAKAVTFNPSGPHAATVVGGGGNFRNAKTLVTVFRVKEEILTTLEDGRRFALIGLLMPDSVGRQFELPAAGSRSLLTPFQLHGMDFVLLGLETLQ
ncbi:MAG: hypothetical protein KDA62_20040, partial [Planctomycetales bacterium]|nr:hypothetical protein [Planctomycetales bacterium]